MCIFYTTRLTTFFLRTLACIFLAALSVTSHAAEQDELTGIYSFMSPYINREVDMVKIEKRDSQYLLFVNQGNEKPDWSGGDAAEPATKGSYEELLGHAKFDDSFTGLETNNAAILKVGAGWKSGPYKTDTGYLWISRMGAIEVRKRPLEKAGHNAANR
jgi:hypothetical protein